MKMLVAALTCCALAACGTGPHAPAHIAGSGAFSATLHETAATAALARPGTRVCREMSVGIAERDWLRGVVEKVEERRIVVKITNAGRYKHFLNGAPIAIGDSVLDPGSLWTPCY